MTKQRSLALFLALVLGLSLTLPALAEAPPPLTREEVIHLEGNEETFLATQYLVPGQYALWYAAADFEPQAVDTGVQFNLLNNFLNAEVSLTVQPAAQGALAAAQAALQQEGWQVVPDQGERFLNNGEPITGWFASKEGLRAQAMLATLPTGSFLITLRYPMEAAEGWGARMHHFAMSIQAAP